MRIILFCTFLSLSVLSKGQEVKRHQTEKICETYSKVAVHYLTKRDSVNGTTSALRTANAVMQGQTLKLELREYCEQLSSKYFETLETLTIALDRKIMARYGIEFSDDYFKKVHSEIHKVF